MIDFSTAGVRDLILLAAMLVGAYLVFLLLRLLRLLRMGRKPLPCREEPQIVFPAELSPPLTEAKENAPAPGFAHELAHSNLEFEVQGLRHDAEQLRVEIAHLVEEMHYLRAARSISPLYGEAMMLAQHVPAVGIVDRRGISIGEAELVALLARSGVESGFHEKDEDRDDRYTDFRN